MYAPMSHPFSPVAREGGKEKRVGGRTPGRKLTFRFESVSPSVLLPTHTLSLLPLETGGGREVGKKPAGIRVLKYE